MLHELIGKGKVLCMLTWLLATPGHRQHGIGRAGERVLAIQREGPNVNYLGQISAKQRWKT